MEHTSLTTLNHPDKVERATDTISGKATAGMGNAIPYPYKWNTGSEECPLLMVQQPFDQYHLISINCSLELPDIMIACVDKTSKNMLQTHYTENLTSTDVLTAYSCFRVGGFIISGTCFVFGILEEVSETTLQVVWNHNDIKKLILRILEPLYVYYKPNIIMFVFVLSLYINTAQLGRS